MGKETQMRINCDKTVYMFEGGRNQLSGSNQPTLNIVYKTIGVSKQKLLDVYIDKNLTWAPHINHIHVCSVIRTKISLLQLFHVAFKNSFNRLMCYTYKIRALMHGELHQVQI